MRAFTHAGWILSASLTAMVLAGCTSVNDYVKNGFKVGPNYGKPPAAVAEDWIDASVDRRIRKESNDHRQWWTVFEDPVLDSLVCAAYQQNLTLREAGWRIMQARASLNIARGNLFAQVQDAAGSYSHNQLSELAANQGFLPKKVFDNFGVGFNLNWELDFWGRFRRSIESAAGTLNASIEDYDDALVTLLSDTAMNYVLFRTLEEQIRLVEKNVEVQQVALKLAEGRYNKGKGNVSELDVHQALSNLAQTESLVPQLKAQSRNVTNALCILLSIPAEDLRARMGPPSPKTPIPTAPPEVAVGVPAELLARRPDIRRAERTAAAQSAQIGVAVADLYPHIAITGAIGWQAEHFADLFKGQSLTGYIGPAFQWNILNYGRLANNIRLQDARFQELVATYQKTVIRASAEVENGLANFLQAQVQTQKMAVSVDAAEKAVIVSLARYKGGLEDFNRVALLQQNLVQQQNLLAQAQGEIAQGLIQVFRPLGGGWQIRLDGCNRTALPTASAVPQTLPDTLSASTASGPTVVNANHGANRSPAPVPNDNLGIWGGTVPAISLGPPR